jgi:hypothetical protein
MVTVKKQKTNFNHTFMLNNTSLHDPFESRPFRRKLRASLIKNLRAIPGVEDDQAAAQLVDRYMREDVFVDMHRFDVLRTHNTLSIVPETGTVIDSNGEPHAFRNGLSVNLRDRRGLNVVAANNQNVFALVGVTNYLPPDKNLHKNHAISAFRHNNVLFCFNPWGEQYIYENKRSGNVLPDNHIWEYLRKRYRCHTAFVYTGDNFQQSNTKGACVGFASEFGSHVFNFMLHQRLFKFDNRTFYHHEQIGRLIYSAEYNAFVVSLFERFQGAFANARHCNISTLTNNLLFKLKSNSVSTKSLTNNVHNVRTSSDTDLFDKISTLLEDETEFRSAMKRSEWLSTNHHRAGEGIDAARANVRRRLREKFPQLKKVHGNTINTNIRRYIASGNIQVKL